MIVLKKIRKIENYSQKNIIFASLKDLMLMEIMFEKVALEELYTHENTQDREYNRLPKDIVKRYVKVVNYMKAVKRVEDLFLINSLHYEKLKGNLKEVEAVRLNKQYRLLFQSLPDESGIMVTALIFDISKHYE